MIENTLYRLGSMIMDFASFFDWDRRLLLNYMELDSSGSTLYKGEGSRRRSSRKREADVPALSKNGVNNTRRSQVRCEAWLSSNGLLVFDNASGHLLLLAKT